MEDTIERRPTRIYHVQYTASGESQVMTFEVVADIMCQKVRSIEFKREGKIVGNVTGKVHAWWIEERGNDA